MRQELQQDEVAKVLGILDVIAKGDIQVLTKWMRERKNSRSEFAAIPAMRPPVQ